MQKQRPWRRCSKNVDVCLVWRFSIKFWTEQGVTRGFCCIIRALDFSFQPQFCCRGQTVNEGSSLCFLLQNTRIEKWMHKYGNIAMDFECFWFFRKGMTPHLLCHKTLAIWWPSLQQKFPYPNEKRARRNTYFIVVYWQRKLQISQSTHRSLNKFIILLFMWAHIVVDPK